MVNEPSLRKVSGPIGMLSKMGGRLISFYADDIAELFLDDFLKDTAKELMRIESLQRDKYVGEEAKCMAENMLKAIVDYQSEEQLLSMKWTNPASQKQFY